MSGVHAPLVPPVRSLSACVLAEGATTEDKQLRYNKTQRRLVAALVVAVVFMVVEAVGGVYAHSLAIITDAAHLLSDVSGFAVSIAAAYYASVASRQHFSYGYHRLEVLGALASVASVWLVTGVLVFEAVQRVRKPEAVDGKLMFILAVLGVIVNLLLVWILGGHHAHSHGGHSHSHGDEGHGCSKAHEAGGGALAEVEEGGPIPTTGTGVGGGASHSELSELAVGEGRGHGHGPHNHGRESGDGDEDKNINVRGAVIHVVGDLVQSVGVAAAGALIWWHQGDPRWALADPVCTFLFAALVLWTTTAILRDIGDVLMERTPRGLSADAVVQQICSIPGVAEVHDLHMWSLTPGIPLLAAHVTLLPDASPRAVLHNVTQYCRGLGIDHTTIQLVSERGACPCGVDNGSSGSSLRGSAAELA